MDDDADTNYNNKLQPYPVGHTLQYMVCQAEGEKLEEISLQ